MTKDNKIDSNENSNLQWTANIPPSYSAVTNTGYASGSYQLPSGQYIYPSNTIHPNQPQIMVANQPIMSVPEPVNGYYTCQRPTYFNGINVNQINMAENYPRGYVMWHCPLLLFGAIALIVVEYFLVLSESPLYSLTSGWYAGGYTVGCACFTFLTSKYI